MCVCILHKFSSPFRQLKTWIHMSKEFSILFQFASSNIAINYLLTLLHQITEYIASLSTVKHILYIAEYAMKQSFTMYVRKHQGKRIDLFIYFTLFILPYISEHQGCESGKWNQFNLHSQILMVWNHEKWNIEMWT